jgi:hypothetical protein
MGCHVMALEEDKERFSALPTSVVCSLVVSSTPQSQDVQLFEDSDIMEIVLTKIKKRHANK